MQLLQEKQYVEVSSFTLVIVYSFIKFILTSIWPDFLCVLCYSVPQSNFGVFCLMLVMTVITLIVCKFFHL